MPFDALEFTRELIRIPSVSAAPSHAEDVRQCAQAIHVKLGLVGFDSQIVKTDLHPIVWAKRAAKTPAKIRILCYGHYDVQPVDPIEKWKTPPFEPQIKNGRLHGRGSADNKGPFMCLFGGLMKFLEANPDAPVDIALMIEGEEEISSPSMAKFIAERRDEISSYDVILLSDTSSPSEDQIVITTGLRGVMAFDVKFTGPNGDLHSGMFGGAVYNPIQAMSEVCASLHGADGRVNIPNFYNDVLPIYEWERAAIAQSPFGEKEMRETLAVDALYSQRGAAPSEALRLLPTLEFTGIGGGYQGEGNKSVISSECFCKISVRLVPNMKGEEIFKLIKRAILERTPAGIKVEVEEPDAYGDAYCVVPPNREGAPVPYPEKLGKVFGAIEISVTENFGKPPLYLREGGSIPLISMLKKETGLDCVMTGLFLPSDNLHAPNESFSLEMMRKAINCYASLFDKIIK